MSATTGVDRWEGGRGGTRGYSCMISSPSPLIGSYDTDWPLTDLDEITVGTVL